MSSLKYRPMAVIGITALILNFVAIITDLVFSCGLVFIAVGAVMTVVLLISKEFGKSTVITYICAAMILSGVLLLTSSVYGIDVAEKFTDKQCQVVGTVTDNEYEYSYSNAYVVRAKTINGTKCDIKIVLYSKSVFNYEPGDRITFSSKLSDNIDSANFTTKISNISAEKYLYSYISDTSKIALVKSGEKTIQHFLYFIRNEISSRICDFLPGKEGAVTVAMLVGDKSVVDNEIIENFRLTGISHLFAVSGLHLSIWVASLYFILKKIIKRFKISEIICIIFTVLFMALTGFTASVCRAGLMLLTVFLAKIFDEETDSLNSLGLSLFIILTISPMSAVGFSLLLSFSATLGIIVLYPSFERKTDEKLYFIKDKNVKRIIKYVLSLAEISLCAMLFTLPISSFFIGNISIIAPVTNIFVSYAATLQMILGGFSALLHSITFVSRPLAFLCGILAKYVIGFSSFLSKIPFCSVSTDSVYFRFAVIIIISGVFCMCMIADNIKKRLMGILSIFISTVFIFTSMFIVFDYSKTVVDVLSTGNSLSVQVKYRGHSLIFGCGGNENYPDESISSLLKFNPDLLLIPDRSRENSSMFLYYIENLNPEKIVCGENNQSIYQIRQDTVTATYYKCKPWQNSDLIFVNDSENTYAYLKNYDTDLLLIFNCSNHLAIPFEYLSSDYIILCNKICNDFDFSSFESIIASSESAEMLSENFTVVNKTFSFEI